MTAPTASANDPPSCTKVCASGFCQVAPLRVFQFSCIMCSFIYQCPCFQIFCPRISGRERTQDVYPSFLPRLIGVRELTESRSIQEEPTFNPSLVGIGGSVRAVGSPMAGRRFWTRRKGGPARIFKSNESSSGRQNNPEFIKRHCFVITGATWVGRIGL